MFWGKSAAYSNQSTFFHPKFAHRQSDLVPKDCLMKLVKVATFATTPQSCYVATFKPPFTRTLWKTLRCFQSFWKKNILCHFAPEVSEVSMTFLTKKHRIFLTFYDFSWQKPYRSPDDAPPWSLFLAHVEFLERWGGVAWFSIMNFRQLGKKQ